mgnify:CR=1 FL=1
MFELNEIEELANQVNLSSLYQIAKNSAQIGNEILKINYNKIQKISSKGRKGDLVTNVDLEVENKIKEYLLDETPNISINAEESGKLNKSSDLTWCIDPLDGTTNYSHGYPFFGTSIGLVYKNKPILISTGMAALDEIGNAIEVAKSSGNGNIALFHCISSYPTPLSEANINALKILRDEFNVQIGLSDHTIGDLSSIVATGLGATVIEKHFTLSRKEGGVDSTFSLEPSEMKMFVNNIKLAFSTIKSKKIIRSSIENENKIFRRSIYFVSDIEIGQKITKSHIRRIRPGFGLEPKYYEEVLGSTCLKKAKRGDRVTFKHFKKMFF